MSVLENAILTYLDSIANISFQKLNLKIRCMTSSPTKKSWNIRSISNVKNKYHRLPLKKPIEIFSTDFNIYIFLRFAKISFGIHTEINFNKNCPKTPIFITSGCFL